MCKKLILIDGDITIKHFVAEDHHPDSVVQPHTDRAPTKCPRLLECNMGDHSWTHGHMYTCKFIVPLRHGGNINSRRAASPLQRLVEGVERVEDPGQPRCPSLKLGWKRAQ
ncbi:hypothetical protein TNCV_2801001 [Trichonephila clavipes]|nr:hypothetical protein TNCV_2801001 [Trichonephila clavipes]